MSRDVNAKSLEVNRDPLALDFALLDLVHAESFKVNRDFPELGLLVVNIDSADLTQHDVVNAKSIEDKLSLLPDELLISILSLISYKEAARTSVLSRRWEKVWTFIPVLNFDGSTTLLHLKEILGRKFKRELVMLERSEFVNCVNSVLESYRGSTIEEFRVRFDLDVDNSNDIQRWANFAFEKNVQRLVMDLRNYEGYTQNKMPRFTPCLPCYTPTVAHISTSLRVVQFQYVDISGEDVGYLMSNCCFLEHLSIKYCDLIVDQKVDVPLLCLKYLDVMHCFNIKSIDISAPNLSTFRCYGPKFVIPFEKIPKVSQVLFGYGCAKYVLFENPSIFSNYFTQLETLALDIWWIEITATLVQFPNLPRLKNLELAITILTYSDNLLFFTPLMKSSPWLETFKMKVTICKPNYGRSKLKGEKCRLKNLKFVEVIGFRGCAIDNAFITYLIENAVTLEKFIINPREPYSIGTPSEHLETDVILAAREKATQLKHKFCYLEDKLLVL